MLNSKANIATMTWSVVGERGSKFEYSGCKLVFDNLREFISPRDPEMPYSEDFTVSAVSAVTPTAGVNLSTG